MLLKMLRHHLFFSFSEREEKKKREKREREKERESGSRARNKRVRLSWRQTFEAARLPSSCREEEEELEKQRIAN